MAQLFDIDRWEEIWQTIARNKKRSIMTALGVFWGIFMLVIMLGAGMGLGRIFQSNLGEMATNMMFFMSDQTAVPYKGMPSGRYWQFETEDIEAVKKLDQVQYASGILWSGGAKCSYNDHKGDYELTGYSPDYQKINPQLMEYGRFINEVDDIQRRKVCVIGTQVYKELFPEGGSPEGKMIKVNDSYFMVVGVSRKQSSMMNFGESEKTIIIPISLMQQMFGGGNNIHGLAVSGYQDVDSKQVEIACKEVVFKRHTISPDDKKAIFTISAAEMFNKIMGLFSGISILTWVVGLGTLFAGIVGISNIMLVLVKERTQEIGVRRALGAKPMTIISQILSESFVLTFIAGILGLGAAVGVLSVVDSLGISPDGNPVSFQISFGIGIAAAVILIAGSLLAGVIPAVRALSIKAVDAIREE